MMTLTTEVSGHRVRKLMGGVLISPVSYVNSLPMGPRNTPPYISVDIAGTTKKGVTIRTWMTFRF